MNKFSTFLKKSYVVYKICNTNNYVSVNEGFSKHLMLPLLILN